MRRLLAGIHDKARLQVRQLVLELLDVVNVFNLVLDVDIHRLHVEFEDYRGVVLLFSESELLHFIQNLKKKINNLIEEILTSGANLATSVLSPSLCIW
jgi:hypothetical protein